MSDHVQVLKKIAKSWEDHAAAHPDGPEVLQKRAAAIRTVLEENKLLRAMSKKWKALAKFRGWPSSKHEKNRRGRRLAEARIEAALALHNEDKGLCLDCSHPGRHEPWPCPTVDALRGEK